MEDAIIKLQMLVGHQEVEISNLSKELYLQQKEIEKLARHFIQLQEKLQAFSDAASSSGDVSQEPPPPHY